VDTRHELSRLAEQIPWDQLAERFGPLYVERGGPGLPLRLLVGLQYVKHLYALSDEEVVARRMENPYWQDFWGNSTFSIRCPLNRPRCPVPAAHWGGGV